MSASLSEIVAAMSEAVVGEGGISLKRKFTGTVVFNVIDKNLIFSLDLKSPNPSVLDGQIEDADLTVEVRSDDLIKLVTGELKPQQAFMKGILKIKGKMNLAMKLTSVLAATKKKLPRTKI